MYFLKSSNILNIMSKEMPTLEEIAQIQREQQSPAKFDRDRELKKVLDFKNEGFEITSEGELKEVRTYLKRIQDAISRFESGRSKNPEEKTREEENINNLAGKILKEINQQGRASKFARSGNLQDYLKKLDPNVRLEILDDLHAQNTDKENQVWTLAGIVSPDGKTMYVMPALDTIVGTGNARKWFSEPGRQYNGTQDLAFEDVKKLAVGEWDGKKNEWIVKQRGVIILESKGER